MIDLKVVKRDGIDFFFQVSSGVTVIAKLRKHGVDELLVLCGGCCSCATCQFFVESGAIGPDQVDSADEDDLLENSDDRQRNSKLSC